MDELVAKVLATPTTITIRELLGASPPTSKKIQEYLRITRPSQRNPENVNYLDKPTNLNPQEHRPTFNPQGRTISQFTS